MWRSPWQYRESLVVTAALLAGGFALQWSIGPLDPRFARWPVNLYLAAFIILWAAVSLGLKKYRVVQWLAGVHLASALILAFLLLSLIMGLTPQGGRPLTWGGGLVSRLGFTGMTSSWPFLLVYLAVLVTLSMASARLLDWEVTLLEYIHRAGPADSQLSAFLDNVVHIGLGFLMLGLISGAAWAKEAWGHYWSWDPKETWAFITAAAYVLYIHLRLRDARPALTLLTLPLGFFFLMITWLGVSLLPSASGSVHVY